MGRLLLAIMQVSRKKWTPRFRMVRREHFGPCLVAWPLFVVGVGGWGWGWSPRGARGGSLLPAEFYQRVEQLVDVSLDQPLLLECLAELRV